MHWLIEILLGCSHRRLTFPMTARKLFGREQIYVCCLTCGAQFEYRWKDMKIGSRLEEQVYQRPSNAAHRWPKCQCGGVAVTNASGEITRTCIRCGRIVRPIYPPNEQTEEELAVEG